MNNQILSSIILFLLSAIQPVLASHINGGSVKYKSLGGNKYYVEATVIRDCSGIQNAVQTVALTAKCSTSSASTNHTLSLTPFVAPTPSPFGGPYASINFTSSSNSFAVQEISDVCDKVLDPNRVPNTRCRGNTNTILGFTLFKYSGIITLSSCDYWTLGFVPVCCRNTGNSSVSSGSIWIEARLNSKDCPSNSSPYFGNEMQPMFNTCVGQVGEYHFGSTDPDGDSLTYKLVCAQQSIASCATYNSGFSGTSPVAGAKLDPTSGRFTFKPASTGKRVIAVRIDEYDRCTKKWCGSTLRDVSMYAQTCTANYPKYVNGIHKVTGSATKLDSFSIKVKTGATFSVEDTLYTSSTTDTLVVLSDYAKIFPGSKLNVTQLAKNRLHYKFSWTPPTSTRGVKYLHITLSDDACNYPRKRRFAIAINFDPQLAISIAGKPKSDTILLMKGDTLNLSSGGSGKVSWKSVFGDSLRWTGSAKNVWGDTILNDTNESIKFRPLINTRLTVSSRIKNDCSTNYKSDSVFIKIIPSFQIRVSDTSVCSNVDSIQLNVQPDSSFTYTYLWESENGKISNNKIANPYVSGNLSGEYWVTVTSQDGGVRRAKMSVFLATEIPKHSIISSVDSICLGGSVELEAKIKNPLISCQPIPKSTRYNHLTSYDSLNVFSDNTTGGMLPNPFAKNYSSSKQLFLYRSKDLNNRGINEGALQSIGFFVDSILSDTLSKTFSSYNIELTCTKDTSINAWSSAKFTKVVSNKSVTVKLGWNEIKFDTAYHWDGSSNLLVQLCYDNGNNVVGNSFTAMQNISYNGNYCVGNSVPTCNSQMISFSNRNRVPVVKFGYAPVVKSSSLIYSWAPSSSVASPSKSKTKASPRMTTNYSVVVTDSIGVCSDTTLKTINVVTGKLDAGKDISQCIGSSVMFQPTVIPNNGGAYTWYPSADFVNNRIKNATLTIKNSTSIWVNYIDSFGCKLTDSVMLTASPSPSPYFATKTKFCETESIGLLNPTNSGGTFTGVGVTGTNFNASDPRVKPNLNQPMGIPIKHSITKNGCTSDTTIMVLVYPQFDTLYSGLREFCAGDPKELLKTRHQGGVWSGTGVSGNEFDPVKASIGIHTIRVDSTGFCGNSASYSFEVLKTPDHDFPDTTYGCNKKPVTLEAGNPGATYLWNTGESTRIITATTSGKYWVKILYGTRCELTDSTEVKITEVCLGISLIHSSKSTIKIFPNPTDQFLSFESENEEISKVELLTLSGQLVQEFEINAKNALIDLEDISVGSYLVRVYRENHSEIYRVVISR